MSIHVKKRNGRLEPVDINKINKVIARACVGLSDVSPSEIAIDANLQFFDKIPTTEIDNALILTASSKIEKEPNYSYVAARLQLNCLYKEVFGEGIDADTFDLLYRKSFISNVKKLVKEGRFDKRMLDFDLKKLAASLHLDRDDLFKFPGIKNLNQRYFTKLNGRRMETPQGFWMRVAMGLAINEPNKDEKAIEFYTALSTFHMCCSTPTLFNSGTTHSQLSSCYLNTFEDSIDGIFDGLWQEARKSKYAGGLGFDVTPFRGTGAFIEGTNGASSGLIPWLKLYNDLLIGVNQGGRRKGAGCAYLEPWHIDVEEFIDLRRTTGDERRRTHDLNTALWIPDLFMEYVEADKEWYLFCPKDVPDLHELYGEAFNTRYLEYIEKAKAGEIKLFKVIKAKDFWKLVLKSIYETSHPWITFKDPSNIRYSNKHEGVVHSSNLCTEILLHTIPSTYVEGVKTQIGETAVCNLASINAPTHVVNGVIDYNKLAETVATAIRMLDNVVDINFYPTAEARNSNLKHRPIGLGIMGFHDVCHMLDIQYDTEAGVQLAGNIQEFIAYHAIKTSSLLAAEKGRYATYDGSEWSKGNLPIDTLADNIEVVRSNELDYDELYEVVRVNGMRNSNVMAIAPTATISYIQGCEQSIEPNFSVLFVYENTAGNTFIINEHFVNDMKKIGIWNPTFAAAVKAVDGDVMRLAIPQKYKDKYKTAFDRDMFKLIEAAGARQKWIDMGQSFNLYVSGKSMKAMNDIAFKAWKEGLKTTYYWRNRSATDIEKSTAEAVTTVPEVKHVEQPAPKLCSLEARMRGEICDSCS
jgi:ribonucleoside-diphosphate reductase alpha chain